MHDPVAKDCLTCHDPHTSANDHLLLKPMTGEKADNLCLTCHDQGVGVSDKGSRHAALDMGCDTCHVTHKVRKLGQEDSMYLLTKAAPELCIACHDPKDEKLVKAHQGQPIAGADCTGCHDPHDSKVPKLLRKYLHQPFADKSCDTCHQPAKDGKVVLTSDGRALCAMCHDEQVKNIDNAKFAHAGAQGDCIQCHNPHGGKYPRFVRPNPVAVCESCHPNEQEIHETKRVLHNPAYQQACSVCHAPHGGEREHLLRAESNDLCLTCHGPNASGAKVAGSDDVTIFNGTVELPGNYLSDVFRLRLNSRGVGHPDDKHPVSGVLDPSDPQKAKMITCLSCHTPHGGAHALLITGVDTSGSLCQKCHTDLRTTAPAPVPMPNSGKAPSRRKGGGQ